MNRLNFRNDYVMMTAPLVLYCVLVLLVSFIIHAHSRIRRCVYELMSTFVTPFINVAFRPNANLKTPAKLVVVQVAVMGKSQ